MTAQHKSRTPVHYRIRLKGHLDDKWSDWFAEMDIAAGDGETILSGQVVDQAALHGILIRIRDLNLTLLSVEQADPEDKK